MEDITQSRLRWRPTLRLRVLAVVWILTVLLAITAAAAFATNRRVERANRSLAQDVLPALVAVERLQKAYLDQETGMRGFALTSQPQFLEPFNEAPTAIEAQEEVLDRTLAAEPGAQAELAAVRQAHDAWLDEAAGPVLAAISGGGRDDALAIIDAGTGKRLFDVLRTRVDVLRSTVQNRVSAAGAQVDDLRRTARWVVGTAFGLAVLLAVVTMLELRRVITRPLDRLVSDVVAVAGGDLDRPVRASGVPEIATIAAAVERMRVRLAEHTRRAVARGQRQSRLDESERIATGLRHSVLDRLVAVGMSLSSLASRHPDAARPLLTTVQELDAVIGELRGTVFGQAEPAGPGQRGLRDRMLRTVERAEARLAAAPTLEFEGRLDLVDERLVDEVVAAVDEVLSTVAAAARLAIRVTVRDEELRLVVTQDATAPEPAGRWAALAGRAERLRGSCAIRPAEDGQTHIEWSVPIRQADPGDR